MMVLPGTLFRVALRSSAWREVYAESRRKQLSPAKRGCGIYEAKSRVDPASRQARRDK